MTWSDIFVKLLFGYPVPPEMVDSRYPLFLQRPGGLVLTLLITVVSLVVGVAIGTAFALCRPEPGGSSRSDGVGVMGRPLSYAAGAVVEGVRGLPIMLLVLLTFHLPYRLAELRFPSFVLAIAAFSLYAGVYLSEIVRSGFRSVGPEFRHVGKVLGLSRWQVLLRIELPLVARNMTPDLMNLAVTVFKDTSTLAVVGVSELTYTGRQMLMSEPINYGLVLFLTLVFYWVPATIVSSAFAFRAERRRAALP